MVGEHETLERDTVTVEGSGDDFTVDDGTEMANVICGNIPTANATVYVIDSVLMPPPDCHLTRQAARIDSWIT